MFRQQLKNPKRALIKKLSGNGRKRRTFGRNTQTNFLKTSAKPSKMESQKYHLLQEPQNLKLSSLGWFREMSQLAGREEYELFVQNLMVFNFLVLEIKYIKKFMLKLNSTMKIKILLMTLRVIKLL